MLSGHLSAISDGSPNILLAQLRIFCDNFLNTHPASQEIKKQRYPYSGAANAGLTEAYI